MQERLQKIIARAGLASRRVAEEMILAGSVSINGKVVRKLGSKADAEKDKIRVNGKLIYPESEKIYIMLNKPRGYVTTLRDPQNRPIVSDLLTDVIVRVFPVGRLDYDSQGLLLLTNDGNFAEKLIHPRNQVIKVYHVKIKGRLLKKEILILRRGVELNDGLFRPDNLREIRVSEKSSWLSITLREGKNRIIRRALNSMGYEVLELVRKRIGGIELGDLDLGQYRLLSKGEVEKIFLNGGN